MFPYFRPVPGFEERKTLTILGGMLVCDMCGGERQRKDWRMCNTCRWHYRRAKYHGVYHFMLREWLVVNTKFEANWRNKECKQCVKLYGKSNPYKFIQEDDREPENA